MTFGKLSAAGHFGVKISDAVIIATMEEVRREPRAMPRASGELSDRSRRAHLQVKGRRRRQRSLRRMHVRDRKMSKRRRYETPPRILINRFPCEDKIVTVICAIPRLDRRNIFATVTSFFVTARMSQFKNRPLLKKICIIAGSSVVVCPRCLEDESPA